MKLKAAVAIFVLGLGAIAGEISPRKDFRGTDDRGTPVSCRYEGTNEPLSQSHYTCRFAEDIHTIVAYGDQSLQQTWCEVQNGVVNHFECVAGIGDFAHYFIRTSESSTGLIACRMPKLPLKPYPTAVCSVHHNPEAGVFGSPAGRANVLSCLDHRGRGLLVESVTEDRKPSYTKGDLGLILFQPGTRVTVTQGKAVRTEDASSVVYATAFVSGPSSVVLALPKRALKKGERVVGRMKIGHSKIYDRVECSAGEAT